MAGALVLALPVQAASTYKPSLGTNEMGQKIRRKPGAWATRV